MGWFWWLDGRESFCTMYYSTNVRSCCMAGGILIFGGPISRGSVVFAGYFDWFLGVGSWVGGGG